MAYDNFYGWVAGFLEGEGCFRTFIRRNGQYRYRTMHITAQSTDEDVILILRDRAGVGTVCGPYFYENSRLGKKPYWQWHVNRLDEVYEICKKILPYMGDRRSQKIREIINDYEEIIRTSWKQKSKRESAL